MPKQDLQNQINQLKQELNQLKQSYSVHQHDNVDGTNYLRKNIVLDFDQSMVVGCMQCITATGFNATDGMNYFGAIIDGEDMRTGIVPETPNMQVLLTHVPNSSGKFSFLTATRNPQLASPSTISVTAAGNTVTTNYALTGNFAGAYINIYDSSRSLVETQVIASNTSSVITIVGTWINTTNNGTFDIYTPVFLGRTQAIWRRLYVEEGTTTGGVRFGAGATGNTQNGLLYMDAAGDLYWRDKAGVSTKLN